MDSPFRSSSWFNEQAKGLDATQQDLLALLALSGGGNISRVTELANAAGLRESRTRQLSTKTVRPHLEALINAGLATHAPEGFGVLRSGKHPALRQAALRGRLGALAETVAREATTSVTLVALTSRRDPFSISISR